MKIKILAATAVFAFIMVFHYGPLLADGCGDIIRVSVYGEDNRMEYCAADDILKALSESTVSFFKSDSLTLGKNGAYTINKEKTLGEEELLGDSRTLGSSESFRNQPTNAFCSGSLVGEDLIMTAGHCVWSETVNPYDGVPCDQLKIVFGYRVEKTGLNPSKAAGGNVYSCKEVVGQVLTETDRDYAIIRLDRKVTGRKPLAINRNQDLQAGTGLVVMGHPTGLPLKIAGEAKVRSVMKDNGFFTADLDTFAGNSGSPVFNAKTLMIEGILVRGARDYEPDAADDSRVTTSKYPQDGGDGEECTLVSEASAYIPVTGSEQAMLEMNAGTANLYGDLLKVMEKRNKPLGRNPGEMQIIKPIYRPPVDVPEPEPIRI